MLSISDKPLAGSCSPRLTSPIPFALISCQRSGTHLFREIFNSNRYVALLVEAFFPLDKAVYWSNYVRTLPSNQYPPLFPDDAMALLDQHLQMIQCDVYEDIEWYGEPKRSLAALGLDVKYNQLRCVTSLLSDLRSPPLLLDYFRSRNFRIIHLVRNNIVHAALSLIIAKLRNVWINDDSTVIQGPFRISWDMLLSEITWIAEERKEFLRWTYDLPLQICSYEDLVADLNRINVAGEFPANTSALRPLAEFLGIPNSFRYTGYYRKVINRPYTELLGDCDELVRALRDSEFSEFADTL